jgi:hypothetical protein
MPEGNHSPCRSSTNESRQCERIFTALMFAVDLKIIDCVFYETLAECITNKFMKGLPQSCRYRERFFEERICSDDLRRGFTATSINKDSEIESKDLTIYKMNRPLIKITKGLIQTINYFLEKNSIMATAPILRSSFTFFIAGRSRRNCT